MNDDWSNTESVCETFKVIKKNLNEWMKEDDNVNVVDKHDERMGIDDNWEYGVRTTGQYKKICKLSCL